MSARDHYRHTTHLGTTEVIFSANGEEISLQPQRPHYTKAPRDSVLGKHFFQEINIVSILID